MYRSKAEKGYVSFLYLGGFLSFVLLIGVIIIKHLYADTNTFLISETVDDILFESLTKVFGLVFGAAIIGTLIDQYRKKVMASGDKISAVYENEGLDGTYDSYSSTEFIARLEALISSAKSEITFVGLGLGVLVYNRNLTHAIGDRLNVVKSLTVTLMFGSPSNKGVLNRAEEEQKYHQDIDYNYDITWMTRFPKEIKSAILSRVTDDSTKKRLKMVSLTSHPMNTIIKVDDTYFFFMYGSPGQRGSESPLVSFSGNGSLRKFFDKVLGDLKNEKSTDV